jgi:ubiquinone/menaquinone biosynthesis C-methylase UbiE
MRWWHGVAFRALPAGREVRYVAIDIDEKMLARARARARASHNALAQVEVVAGDMLELPFDDGEADLVLSYSGLHMVSDPERAVRELDACSAPLDLGGSWLVVRVGPRWGTSSGR